MDREADFIWHPCVSIVDGFSLALFDGDIESDVSAYSFLLARTPLWLFPCGPSSSWARYNLHRVRRQFGYDQGVPSQLLSSCKLEGFTPHSVALRAMKVDALTPLNCAITMRPLPRPEVPSSPVVSKGRVDIPDSFEDDLLDDCENVVVPIAAASPFIAIEQRSLVGMGTLDVSKGVNAVGEATNIKLVIAKASFVHTLQLVFMLLTYKFMLPSVWALRHPSMPPLYRILRLNPCPCLDSLSLISNGEHIEAFLGRHNDFIGQLTVDSIVRNPLLRILAAMLMDMQETQVNALIEERLFKWRDAVRDLHKASFEVSLFSVIFKMLLHRGFVEM
nr:hypothetical protein CFP56_25206 [Quercus suber]